MSQQPIIVTEFSGPRGLRGPQGDPGEGVVDYFVPDAASVLVRDGETDNTSALEGLLSPLLGEAISVPSGTVLVSEDFSNPGVRLNGPGIVEQMDEAGRRQISTYADDGIFVGAENMHAFVSSLSDPFTAVKGGIFADSTGTDAYFSVPYRLSYFLEVLCAKDHGVPCKVACDNYSIAGISWSSFITGSPAAPTNPVSILAADRKILFFKLGVNDAAYDPDSPTPIEERLQAMADAMRSVLSAIRAAPHGDLASLSIVLVGPTSTYDIPHGRDESFYERLRSIYVAVGREFQTGYFDTYAYLRDVKAGAAVGYLTGDIPGFPASVVHPLDLVSARVWGGVMSHVISSGLLSVMAVNTWQNLSSAHVTFKASVQPGSYGKGGIGFRALQGGSGWVTGDAWDVDGMVWGWRVQDDISMLFNGGYQKPWIFGRTGQATWQRSQSMFDNVPLAQQPSATDAPSTYPRLTQLAMVTTDSGWPVNGQLLSMGSADTTVDHRVVQYLISDADGTLMTRTGSGAAWGGWIKAAPELPATDCTLPAGFVHGATGERFQVVRSGPLCAGHGYAQLSTPGTISAGTAIGTIPIGFRPSTVALGVLLLAYDGSTYTPVRAKIDGTTLSLMEAVAVTATRLYFAGAVWTIY